MEAYVVGVGDGSGREVSAVVTQGPWAPRDAFVAETSVRLDRVQDKIERLEAQGEVAKQHITDLMDNAQQVARFQAFAESLRNARDYKLDELLRGLKDVKARLERIEGPKAEFAGLTVKSFKDVDGRFQAIAALDRKLERAMRFAVIAGVAATLAFGAVVADLVLRPF